MSIVDILLQSLQALQNEYRKAAPEEKSIWAREIKKTQRDLARVRGYLIAHRGATPIAPESQPTPLCCNLPAQR